MQNLNEHFRRLARKAADAVGSSWAFLGAALVILLWAVTGPIFHFSDTWQLVINTGTSVATFLMVFLIQNTQNRDSRAIHLKLDELLRAINKARTELVDLEDMPDDELKELQGQFERLREQIEKHGQSHSQPAAGAATADQEGENPAEADARRPHDKSGRKVPRNGGGRS